MKMNIQESFVGKTLNRKTSDIVPKKLELDEQSFFSLLSEYTDSLGIITNLSNGDIVDTKSESGREFPVVVKKEVKRYLFKPVSGLVGGSFVVSLVVSPYSYFWGKATEIPVFDLDFKVLFYPNNNEIRIGIYVNNYKAKCCRKNGVSYEVVPRHFFRKSDGRFLDKSHDFFSRPQKFFELTKMGVDSDTLEICKNYIKRIADFKVEPEKGVGVLNLSNDSLEDSVIKVQSIFGDELFCLEEKVLESFTKKVSRKNSSDLISDIDYPDGVYILHDTLGVKTVDGWNSENNNGVVGVLVVEDGHKIVVALEDSPKNLHWSKKRKLVNQPFDESEKSDFNGEYYCQKLNSSNFPAAYYCKTYNKGGRNWYLPSSGELWLIYQHLEEIQNALSIVGGQRFVTVRGEDTPVYWSSTEDSAMYAWAMGIGNIGWCNKIGDRYKVRPVSNFNLSELKESFVKKTRKSNSEDIVHDADDKAFNPLIDAKEFINRLEECILSYKQPYVYGKKNPYNLEKFSFEMITSWPNTFKFNRQNYNSSELLFDVSNSKKPSFRIKLSFFVNFYSVNHSKNIICYLTVGPIKLNKEGIYEDRLFQYIYDSKKKRISFVENPEGVRFDDNMESIEPTLRNLNFILNDIRFLMDNWKILYKTYLKKNSFETWNEFYKMLPSQNNKGFDFDLKESFTHKISKKTSDSLKGGEMFGEMESFGEFDMLFKKFLKKHEHQFSSCFTTNYPFKSKMITRIGYKVVLKKDCPFEDGSDDRTVLRLSLDVFQRDIMNFPEDQYLNTPHGILTVAFYTELGPSTPQQINLANLEFIGGNESPVDFRFVKFKERREWEKPNFSYQLLFGLERFLMALVETMNNMDEQTWSEIGRTSANFNPFKGEACCGADSKIILDILDNHGFYSELHKNFSKVNLTDLNESFTKKVSSKKNSDLVPDISYPNGVYIVHETLGIESYLDWKWNPDANKGVIGILVVENEHQIMVSLEDAPEVFKWSEKHKLVNRPKNSNEAESDFNGEEYHKRLNSPDFPASYYCSSYNKGGRNWYLPSLGELRLIYRNLDDIQTALEIVDGQSIVDSWGEGNPVYGSSTEFNTKRVWTLGFEDGFLYNNNDKVNGFYKVRPVSKFKPSELRESFTKKIKNKSSKDLADNQSFQLDNGLYILHDTLGVQDVETWDSKYNKGVVGVLLIHNEHKFVASVDVSPKMYWSEKTGNFTSEQYRKKAYALGDYDSEKNCSVLNSPEFPAAYYCLNYNKGGRKWRLGSLGEMSLLMTRYREDFDRILEKVGAVNLKGRGKTNSNWYWTSTEYSRGKAWTFYLDSSWSNAFGTIERYKTEDAFTVIPVSTFEYNNLEESFVGKVSRKRRSDLVPDLDYPDGVYILHETLGVKTVEGWNPDNNDGVVGVLVVKGEHQLVVALEDSPENLSWSTMKYDLMNQPIVSQKDAKSDFNGEEYCIYLNSPYFPAAYYCLNYNKGHRGWHLPSSGELWLIYQNFEEIQTALTIVGGRKFVTDWDENVPWYWSSTENSSVYAWFLTFTNLTLRYGNDKVNTVLKVRPVSNFKPFELRESFTKKTTTKEREENETSTSICSIG